jgi:tripartite-type tricarboxylate transporter receptor subunit TctC
MNRRQFTALAAASVFAPALLARQTAARDWPVRPVRIIVGFGGGLDAAARILADRLTALSAQQVIVEAKTGAGGNLAAEMVARAIPDGHTLLLAGTPLAVNRYLYPSLSYDAAADFAPITLLSVQPNVMVVPNSSPAHSVAEFVALAKARPGKLTYGSAGHGTTLHLCGELFKRVTDVEITHVPYRGVVSIPDLIAGRIDAAFPSFALVSPLIAAGQVRALAIAWPKRIAAAPELPTFSEAGVVGLDDVLLWFGLFAPAKTPSAIIARIHADTVSALADDAVKHRFERIGATPVGSTPAALAHHFKAEMERWEPVIRDGRITINE